MRSPASLLIGAQLLKTIADAAEHAYPEECCGLLIGRRHDSSIWVTRAQPSGNAVAGARNRRFEIEPAVRFGLMRTLRGGPDAIVGHYHSHPDHPCEPSPRDVAAAFEPDLVWLIVALSNGRATQTAAFRIDGAGITRLDLVMSGPPPEPV